MTQSTLLDTRTYPRLSHLTDVIDACAQHPEVQPFARVVGRWVWCEFPSKPSADVRDFLKGSGFRWNADRAAWQHNCGMFTRRNRRIDPRAVYGQQHIAGEPTTRDHAMQQQHDRLSAELSNFQTA